MVDTSELVFHDADVLIIGGGFAGIWAAIRASEGASRVILLDKAKVSRSGASTISGGVTNCPFETDDLDAWAEEFITLGDHLCDPTWTTALLAGQLERVRDFERWGVPINRDANGAILRYASRGMVEVRCMQYSPRKAMELLREQALQRGVEIIDRICVTDLLRQDDNPALGSPVGGAVGFHVREGSFHILRARQTILATGAAGMKGQLRVDNDTGDGMAMAFRAGARLVDMEFTAGGTFTLLMKNFFLGSYNIAVAHGAKLINAQGERFMEKLDPVRRERSELNFVMAAFAKELIDSRGPIYLDLTQCGPDYWDAVKKIPTAAILFSDRLPDPKIHPIPIEPMYGLGNQCRSGVHIDYQCRTDVPGLLAAGAAAKNYATGSHSSAGVPTAFCYNTGWISGEAAGRDSKQTDFIRLRNSDIRRLRDEAFAPLARNSSQTPDDLHAQLSSVAGSFVERLIQNGSTLHRLVGNAQSVLSDCQSARASDLHELVKLHEARNIATCAEVAYSAALARTESRDQHYREDFPYTDDVNWFCFHSAKQTDFGDRLRTGADSNLKIQDSTFDERASAESDSGFDGRLV